MFRYWNGSTWSAQLSPTPQAAPPYGTLGQPVGQTAYSPNQPLGGRSPYAPQQQTKRGPGIWIALAVGALVFLLIGYLVVRALSGGNTAGPGQPGGNGTTNPCPKQKVLPTPVAHPNDGRVHGGMLSYPKLPDPWSAPQADTRVPFGQDVAAQTVTVEKDYAGKGQDWVASVLVGELVAGDGFYSPREGSDIVVKCLVGAFYGDAKVGREDLVSKAVTVDGKEAWLTESHLTFDIKGLKTKGELAIVLIVATSAESSSLFYASIPDTSPEYVQPARDAMAALKVGA